MMSNEEIDLAELTRRLGAEAHEQEAVLSWSGERAGHLWTETEAKELAEAWKADADHLGNDGVPERTGRKEYVMIGKRRIIETN